MKVIFLFMSKGSAPKDSVVGDSWKKVKASNHYQKTFGDECYFKMFKSLLDNKTITDLKVFFESGVSPGFASFVEGAENFVIPEINMVKEFIDEDTVIFVRGGFKHWHDFLLEYKGKNWLICYAANTGRDKWKWWDIVFDDLSMSNEIDRHGRYHFPFIKPTNEDIFNVKAGPLKYDICIGASNIHDKKGQYKSVELLETFQEIYGYYPSAVMPGAPRRSLHTSKMLKKDVMLNEIHLPGMLSKPKLADLFSSCKIFLHLGTGGQNDRSILEAAACGLPVVLSNSRRFTPLLTDDGNSTFVFNSDHTIDQWATNLFCILGKFKIKDKWERSQIYKNRMGYNEVVMPMLTTFFKTLDGTKPDQFTQEKLVNKFKQFKKG